MATSEVLTEREQQGLWNTCSRRRSWELYQLRKPLVRKGALGPARREPKESTTADKASAFLPVRVVSAAPAPGSSAVACRLVHPSGWVLECSGLPLARWVTAVLAGDAYTAT